MKRPGADADTNLVEIRVRSVKFASRTSPFGATETMA